MNLLDSVLLEQFTHEGLLRTSSLLPVLCEPAVEVTGTATAAIDRMHFCSGTSADYTVTLPAAAGNAGHYIGFRMASSLTKMVTLDGNASEMIDDALTRVLWKSEMAILFCDGAAWRRDFGRSIPMAAKASMASGVTATSAVNTKLAVTGATYDNTGQMINTASGRVDIKRDGTYQLAVSAGQTNDAVVNGSIYLAIYKNGANFEQSAFFKDASTTYPTFSFNAEALLLNGDYIELYVVQYSGSDKFFNGNRISLTEIPQW